MSSRSSIDEAFDDTVRSVSECLPLLMYGSGDVAADAINPETQDLVAALTVEYMGQLVNAAVDAREMLLDSKKCNSEPRIPPAPLRSSRKPSLPAPPTSNNSNKLLQTTTPLPSVPSATTALTRKRKSDEFWDDPLPEPKIRNKAAAAKPPNEQDTTKTDPDEWVGLAGVDLWESSGSRRPKDVYTRGITAQQFIFPLCHDPMLYGRIREVQNAKLTVFEPALQDSTVFDMVRTEGNLQYEEEQKQRRRQHHQQHRPSKKDGKNADGDPEEEDEDNDDEDTEADEEEEGGPTWPGLEDLLPSHRNVSS